MWKETTGCDRSHRFSKARRDLDLPPSILSRHLLWLRFKDSCYMQRRLPTARATSNFAVVSVLNGWPTTAQRSSSSGASERLTSVYTILCERKNPVTRGQGALSLSSCQSLGPVAAHVLIVCWLNAGAYSHMTILSAQLHLSRRFWNSLSNQTPLSCSLPR